MQIWKNIDVEFLKIYGYECPGDSQKVVKGMNFSEATTYSKERFALSLTLDKIKHVWTEMPLDKYHHQVPLGHGVRESLQHVECLGLSCGIVTNNGRKMMDAMIEVPRIDSYFQVVITIYEVATGKPEPDIYLKVAGTLQVGPTNCLVFEDIPAGILAEKRTGMTVCAVEDALPIGMREEKRRLADYFINDYLDILSGAVE